jgi:adenine deaminase
MRGKGLASCLRISKIIPKGPIHAELALPIGGIIRDKPMEVIVQGMYNLQKK